MSAAPSFDKMRRQTANILQTVNMAALKTISMTAASMLSAVGAAYVTAFLVYEGVITLATGTGDIPVLFMIGSMVLEVVASMHLYRCMLSRVTIDISESTLILNFTMTLGRCIYTYLQDTSCYTIPGEGWDLWHTSVICSFLSALVVLLQFLSLKPSMGSDSPVTEADTMRVWHLLPMMVVATLAVQSGFTCAGNGSWHWADLVFGYVQVAGTVVMLPQIWLAARLGNAKSESSTFVMVMTSARVLSGLFWVGSTDEYGASAFMLLVCHIAIVADFVFNCLHSWFTSKSLTFNLPL